MSTRISSSYIAGKIYFLDETWLNAAEMLRYGWEDTLVQTNPHLAKSGSSLCYGPKQPSGKGKRLIIAHIGSKDGFLPNALLMFESKKTGDYHEDMDGDRFEDWFSKAVLPQLKPEDTVVMDNASYHSVLIEKAPTSASKREEMLIWLRNRKYRIRKWKTAKRLRKPSCTSGSSCPIATISSTKSTGSMSWLRAKA